MDYLSHKKLITTSIVLLFIQFWLGISLNLFVDIPRDTFLNFFGYSGGIEVLAHIVNGFLILAISLATLRQKVARLSFLATLFVAAAIVTGFVYILNTYDTPSYSMAMAMSFIIAYTIFFYELKG